MMPIRSSSASHRDVRFSTLLSIAAGLTLVAVACDKQLVAPDGRFEHAAANAAPFTGAHLAMDVQPSKIDLFTTPNVDVILFSTASFDAAAVNVANTRLLFGTVTPGAAVDVHGKKAVSSVRDYNGDGRPDRLFTFNTADLLAAGLVGGNPSLTLQDITSAERQFVATDATPPAFVGGATAIRRASDDPGLIVQGNARTLRVRLVDASGAGVGGKPGCLHAPSPPAALHCLRVQWAVVSGGGSLEGGGSTASVMTDASGYSQVTWTAGPGHGGQRVVATAPGLVNSPVAFVGIVTESDGSVRVSPQVESSNSVTAMIGSTGGVITATGANGTRYSLVVPPNGLMDPQSITVTPLADVPDAPLPGGSVFGVQLAPEGLRFTVPARLDVTLPDGSAIGDVVGYGYAGTVMAFHLAPTARSGATFSFGVAHFSGFGGGGLGLPPALPGPFAQLPAVIDEATAETALAIIQTIALASQRLNIPYDANAAIAGVLRSWYDNAVGPELAAAGTDDARLDGAVTRFARWQQVFQSTGLSDADLQSRVEAGRALLEPAFKNALSKTRDRCIATEALSEASKSLLLGKQAEVLGVPGMSEATARADLCVSTAIAQAQKPTLVKGQSATVRFKPMVRFNGAAGGAGSVAASRSMAPATPEIPFYVTATPEGTTNDVQVSTTTAPAGEFVLNVTPAAGATAVKVRVQACMRAPDLYRLDTVCEEKTETYPLGGRVLTGNVTIRNNADVEPLGDVSEITGNLTINGTSVLSLAPLAQLTKVRGDVTISGDMPSIAGMGALQSVGSLVVDHANALTSLQGLNGLTDAGSSIRIQNNPNLTSLRGLENVTKFSLGYPSGAGLAFNAKLTDISALRGLVPALQQFGVYGNTVLADLSPMAGITSLPYGFSLHGPAITSIAAFASLTSVGQLLTINAEDLPALGRYVLPGLTQAQSGVNISTSNRGSGGSLTTVSLPALTTAPGFGIGGDGVRAGIKNVYAPALTNGSVSINGTVGMDTVDISGLNSLTTGGRVAINDNQPVPVITIGKVATVSISNGVWSTAPRLTYRRPGGATGGLGNVSIVESETLIIDGGANWASFGPSVGKTRSVQVINVEEEYILNSADVLVDVLHPNLLKVCGWMRGVNVPDIILLPQRKSISIVRADMPIGPVDSSNGFASSFAFICGP